MIKMMMLSVSNTAKKVSPSLKSIKAIPSSFFRSLPLRYYYSVSLSSSSPLLILSSSSLRQPQRHYRVSPPLLCPSPSTAAAETNNNNNNNNNNSNESALDIALRVNQLKKTHQSGSKSFNNNNNPLANKKEIEAEAWRVLNSLSDSAIEKAEGKAIALLLNSWAYFSKYWKHGQEGP